ncbi:MAG: RluA family pseudouridine synthase [Minisyncoccia bacterium]
MGNINFTVSSKESSLRLDKYLVSRIKNYSREFIIKAIKNSNILVNGLKKKPSYLLKTNDYITAILISNNDSLSLIPLKLIPEPEILYEDGDFLVINKPAGVVTHPSFNKINEPSIASWFILKYPQAKKVGEDPLRPGIVHRLDKDTSGVLVLTKNQKTFLYFKNLFLTKKIQKQYLVLVKGIIQKNQGQINFSLMRSTSSGKRKIVLSQEQNTPKTKTAFTAYQVEKRYKKFTLLAVSPQTGRTHQIRIHLASIGFPVAGDKLYGKPQKGESFIPRQMLHAQRLTFIAPNNQKFSIEAPLPYDFEQVLKIIAKN